MYICNIKGWKKMKVNYKKSGNNSQIFVKEYLSDLDFYKSVIEVFQVLYLQKKYRLSEKEVSFASCVLYNISKGIRDIEKSGDLSVFNTLGFNSKHTIQVWRKKLVKKFWLKFIDGDYFFTEKLIEDYSQVFESAFSIQFLKWRDEI